MYLDSKSAIDFCFDAVAFKKTKHVLRDAFFLRDLVQRLYFAPKHVTSENMLADILTKPSIRSPARASQPCGGHGNPCLQEGLTRPTHTVVYVYTTVW